MQLCFSKGLGCPFGAVLAVDADLEPRVRRIKQRLGGALRQAGIVAGGMLYALDHHVQRLAEDHDRAARLVSALGQFHAVEVLMPVETNIIYMRYRRGSAAELAERLRERGVLVSQAGDRLRACTHLGITDRGLERAIEVFADVLKH